MSFLPISTTNPATLGFTAIANTAMPPSAFWNFPAPRKTNTFWSNLISSQGTGDQNVATYPYLYGTQTSYLEIGYNDNKSSSTGGYNDGQSKVLRAKTTIPFTARKVMSQNVFGVEYLYTTATASQELKTWFISGQAFTTLKYLNLTPRIEVDGALLRVNNNTSTILSTTFTGQNFELEFNNGQIWNIYTPVPISFNVLNTPNWAIEFTAVYNNIIKICYLSKISDSTGLNASRKAVMDIYGNTDTYVIGGNIDNTTFSGNTANFQISWQKVGTSPLLMLTVPHHESTIQSPNYKNVSLRSMKGIQKAIEGDSWLFVESLTTKYLNYNTLNPSDIPAIQTALTTDYTFVPNSDTDTYFGYKELQKLAQIAVIANQIGDTTKRNFAVATLKSKINIWLNATNPNPMKYDTSYGGFVSTDSQANSGAAFGSGAYNDHHFHYGYILQAAAVVTEYDPTWATATVKDKLNLYARDIFNPSTSDTYFPQFRSKDWYSGHAWAGGTFVYGDVNNQESTSEDINGMYGMYCWFKASGQTVMADLARLALKLSQKAAQRYWHIPDTLVYDGIFAANLMVGILWATKADYATFFGAYDEYIHGIQMIPFTPVSEETYPNSTYNANHWNFLNTRIINRTFAIATEQLVSGSGYSGSNGSFVVGTDTFTIANNVQVTGGNGTGLLVNMNINMTQGGKIWEVYVVGTAQGTGYSNLDQVSVVSPSGGLTGGSGGNFKVRTKADDGWLGLLYKQRAYTNPNDAWTKINTLSNFDNGDSKTASLAYVAQYRTGASLSSPAVTLGTVSQTNAVINWSSVAGATAYELQVSLAADPTFTSPVFSNLSFTSLAQTVGSLVANTAYIYRIRAKDATPIYSTYTTGNFTTTANSMKTLILDAFGSQNTQIIIGTGSGPYYQTIEPFRVNLGDFVTNSYFDNSSNGGSYYIQNHTGKVCTLESVKAYINQGTTTASSQIIFKNNGVAFLTYTIPANSTIAEYILPIPATVTFNNPKNKITIEIIGNEPSIDFETFITLKYT
jgi:endo-1,3(4)-beta-glucanase